MTDKANNIPVVNFTSCSLQTSYLDLKSGDVVEVAKRVVDAFSTIGFVYLQNCGVSKDLLQSAFVCSKEFFSLPQDVKEKYKAIPENYYQGYFGKEEEIFDPAAPGDLKESFDFNLAVIDAPIWTTEIKQFKSIMMKFFEECSHLTSRILKLLAIGLELDDTNFFDRCHNFLTMTQGYGSTVRTLYYPQVSSDSLKKGQSRLGEHTDYGTVTLVFQDEAGGLQVRGTDMEWIDATPIEGTVLVNIADLLQRWTSDKLISTAHRMVVPEDGNRKYTKARQSLVFFAQSDPEVEIVCIDGSNRYEPVKSGEYLKRRLVETTFNY